jgi:nucleotide-binding universal stress UspA family protein
MSKFAALVSHLIHESNSTATPHRVIVLPLDKTEHSSETLDWTLKTIATKSDQLVLLHVRHSGLPQHIATILHDQLLDPHSDKVRLEAEKMLRDEAQAFVQKMVQRVTDAGLDCRAFVLVGDAREQLQLKIEKLNPDFVVMGSRSSNTVKGMILGSVAKHILYHSNTPVLIRNMQ